MTFSIVARDPATNEIGAAVATGTPAVGGFVLHVLPGAGAVATQGYSTNTLYGPRGLRMLDDGVSGPEVCRRLVEDDIGRDYRQVIVIDQTGRTGGWTGDENAASKNHICEDNLAMAANWVASESVPGEMRRAYLQARSRPMIERLLAALRAGERAGGDRRGAQSAAAVVVGPDRPPLDLRVDLDEAPIDRLEKIYGVVEDASFRDFLNRMPTIEDPMRR